MSKILLFSVFEHLTIESKMFLFSRESFFIGMPHNLTTVNSTFVQSHVIQYAENLLYHANDEIQTAFRKSCNNDHRKFLSITLETHLNHTKKKVYGNAYKCAAVVAC